MALVHRFLIRRAIRRLLLLAFLALVAGMWLQEATEIVTYCTAPGYECAAVRQPDVVLRTIGGIVTVFAPVLLAAGVLLSSWLAWLRLQDRLRREDEPSTF